MRIRVSSVIAALFLLVGTSFADPFTGRYLIKSTEDRGVSISGYIDFVNAPMGTTAFNLGDGTGIVSDWMIQASGTGVSTLQYTPSSPLVERTDDSILFDNPLGAAVLKPDINAASPAHSGWFARGDLGGAYPGHDSILLFVDHYDPYRYTFWWYGYDHRAFWSGLGDTQSAPAWWLVLDPTSVPHPVPEPGSLFLMILGTAGAFVCRGRKRAE